MSLDDDLLDRIEAILQRALAGEDVAADIDALPADAAVSARELVAGVRGLTRRATPGGITDEEATLAKIRRRSADDHGAIDAGTAPRYTIGDEIGRGGVGVVYRGHDEDLDREVAVKILRDEGIAQRAALQRFVTEARIGGRLQHPGIVPVYELGVRSDGNPFFAMKLVDGRDFASVLRTRDSDDLARLCEIFGQVAQTIAYAHARGVIHRDLKPQNVMIGAFGEVQVVDWGLAKDAGEVDESRTSNATAAAADRSGTGSVIGTPAYMAPEQARGELDAVDRRSDVFGLGAILCEILTGQPPYAGVDRAEVLAHARNAATDAAIARLESCHHDRPLVLLAMSCLQENPDARPRDAGAVADRVQLWSASVQQRARQAELDAATARARAASERRARRLTVALVGAGLLLLLGAGTAFMLVQQDRERRAAIAESSIRRAIQRARADEREAGRHETTELAAWTRALGRLDGIETLTDFELVPDALRREARALRDQLRSERDATASQIANAERTREVRRALRDALTPRTEVIGRDFPTRVDIAALDQQHLDAFRALGADPTASPVATIAAAFGPDVGPEVACALSAWALIRRRLGDPSWQRLATAADSLDDQDAVRSALRDVVFRSAPEEFDAAARALDLSSQPYAAHLTLSLAWIERGDWSAVSDLLVPAAYSRHGDAALAFWAGTALERSEDLAGAAIFFGIATTADPDMTEASHRLGVVRDRLGDFNGAVSVFRALARRDPANLHWRNHIATTLLRARDIPAARAAIEESANGVGHDDPTTQRALAAVLHGAGELDAARSACVRALELAPGDLDARRRLGAIEIARGETGAAIALLERVAAESTDPIVVHNTRQLLYSAYQRHGQSEAALESLQRVTESPLAVALDLQRYGRALLRAFRYAEADNTFRRAIALDPDDVRTLIGLSTTSLAFGRVGDAVTFAHRARSAAGPELTRSLRISIARQLAEAERARSAALPGLLEPVRSAIRDDRCWAAMQSFLAAEAQLGTPPPAELLALRFDAAIAALRAGSGAGADPPPRALRQTCVIAAHSWLDAELAAVRVRLADPAHRAEARATLRRWLDDPRLAPSRDTDRASLRRLFSTWWSAVETAAR